MEEKVVDSSSYAAKQEVPSRAEDVPNKANEGSNLKQSVKAYMSHSMGNRGNNTNSTMDTNTQKPKQSFNSSLSTPNAGLSVNNKYREGKSTNNHQSFNSSLSTPNSGLSMGSSPGVLSMFGGANSIRTTNINKAATKAKKAKIARKAYRTKRAMRVKKNPRGLGHIGW